MFNFFKNTFKKTYSFLGKRILSLFSSPLDEKSLCDLEKILYEADLGSNIVNEFIEEIKKFHKETPNANGNDYINKLERLSVELLQTPPKVFGNKPLENMPTVILIVGANGTGKTTTIAKLANIFKTNNKKVLLVAADTFRSAAVEQLNVWSKRIGTDIVLGCANGDPSGVLYDAMSKAITKNFDVLICDTAGRLESKTNLMQELEKMSRIAKKQDKDAPHETYIIVDGSLGQTAIEQCRIFNKFTNLTGIIITKLDGTAKGGVVLPLYREFGIPIKYIGVGEKIGDIIPFNANEYARKLFYE